MLAKPGRVHLWHVPRLHDNEFLCTTCILQHAQVMILFIGQTMQLFCVFWAFDYHDTCTRRWCVYASHSNVHTRYTSTCIDKHARFLFLLSQQLFRIHVYIHIYIYIYYIYTHTHAHARTHTYIYTTQGGVAEVPYKSARSLDALYNFAVTASQDPEVCFLLTSMPCCLAWLF